MRAIRSVATLARALASGEMTARRLAEQGIEVIDDPSGEGSRAFVALDRDKVIDQARASDMLRARGIVPSPLAGIPVSVKDLFDVAGEATRAGSIVLEDAPARRDASAVARLRAAGAVIAGRTNMTEFAYSGVGLNPHHGTPANPHDRDRVRVPGGSSSGAAVSVSDAMTPLAIGTDTGGSCRIPAALCGVVGFKTTAARIPLDGCIPLAPSYDSVGCIGPSASCVAIADAAMAGETLEPLEAADLAGVRIAVPETLVLDDAEEEVTGAFTRALSRLSRQGATIRHVRLEELAEVPQLARDGGIVAAEAHAWHADLVRERGDDYDPRIRARIVMGRDIDATTYIRLLEERQRLIRAYENATKDVDAVAFPTVPIVAPAVSEFDGDERFTHLNKLLLRNPSIANALDRCAVSVPCHEPGEPPVGLMLMGNQGADRRILRLGSAIEGVVRDTRPG